VVVEVCDGEEVVRCVSHDPLGEVSNLRCDSCGAGRLSGIT
jgi:hypothetical protein